jgi:SAM-dependent methyltransferase
MPQLAPNSSSPEASISPCRACGRPAAGLFCEACATRAREDFLELPGGDADLSGYDASVYDELAALEPTSFWFRGRSKVLVWALRRTFPDARTFLEVGCGSGYTLASIAAGVPSLTVAGGDVHPEGLRVARRRLGGVPLFQLDARVLPFDGDFDVVGAFDVLEHIPDDRTAFKALRNAVRPGGGVIVTVPQHQWLWSPVDEVARHQRRYSREELIERLRDAGLDPIRVTSFMSLLLPLMIVARKRAAPADEYDFRSEFGLPRLVDASLEAVVTAERALLRSGLTLPAGGSLLAVARRVA